MISVITKNISPNLDVCKLQAGIPDAPDMKQSILDKKAQERKFLEQLMDSSKLENYQVDVPIQAELRKYQQVRIVCNL